MSDFRNPNLGLVDSRSGGWRENLGKSRIWLDYPKSAQWWTGKAPVHGVCPGVNENGRIRALPMPCLKTCTRQNVLDYFDNGWTLTEVLFSSLLTDEAFYRPPYHGLRHPLIFYYAHPAVLYINKLRLANLHSGPVDELFESLFETGVDEMSWDDMSKNEIDWPNVDSVHEYRRTVYGIITDLIKNHQALADGHATIDRDSSLWALFMGFEHERIHLETSSVLIRELPVQLVQRPAEWPDYCSVSVAGSPGPLLGQDYPPNELLSVPEGLAKIGKPSNFPTYGWDNEYGGRTRTIPEFFATRYLICNGEFWQFVADGGYQKKNFWSETGWKWREFRNVKAPTFWVPSGPAGSHEYKLRTCFEVIAMQWDWPAIVNFHEAKAYLKWRTQRDGIDGSYRLMSEMEQCRLRNQVEPEPEGHRCQRGALAELEPPLEANIELRFGSEGPVERAETGHQKFTDVVGNVWQWCEDHFNPLTGFKVHKFYDDFSTPCFDGEHQMILGGSFISAGDEASPFARFHFRPHFFQHAGFRMIHSPTGSMGGAAKIGSPEFVGERYEFTKTLSAYLANHYGTTELQMPFGNGPTEATSFPQRAAHKLIDWCKKLDVRTERALDICCGVGGATFALANMFDHVVGIDLSSKCIETAKTLQGSGSINYEVCEEGQIMTECVATIDKSLRDRVTFRRADACSLPADFVDFDAVLLANALDRLPSPMSLLGRLAGPRGIVKKGGIVLITTPFTWQEQYTPKAIWLGGYVDEEGHPKWSFDGLMEAMSADFELLEETDMPLLIREHRRKYHYIVAMASVWRRRQ